MYILPTPYSSFSWLATRQRIKIGPSPLTFWAKLSHIFSPIEDQWTLQSLEGEIFEEVEIESVEKGIVVIKHRTGTTQIPIALLTEKSQQRLDEGLAAAGRSISEHELCPNAKPAKR